MNEEEKKRFKARMNATFYERLLKRPQPSFVRIVNLPVIPIKTLPSLWPQPRLTLDARLSRLPINGPSKEDLELFDRLFIECKVMMEEAGE